MIDHAENKSIPGPRVKPPAEILETFEGYGGPSMPRVERTRCVTCKRVMQWSGHLIHAKDCPHFDPTHDNLP